MNASVAVLANDAPRAVATSSDPVDALLQSYGRCLSSPAFLDTLLERLAAGRVGSYARIDAAESRLLVRRALSSAILAARGSASGVSMLDDIADRHARTGPAALEPAAYAAWTFAVLASVAQFDAQWSGELEREWRELLERLTARFAEAF
jgi:hypothetical protein